MKLFDYLKFLCLKKDHEVLMGECIPFYMINRYFSFVSIPHALLINNFLNFQHLDGTSSQKLWELTNFIIPESKYNWNMFDGYVKLPEKTETEVKNLEEKLEFLEKYLDCSEKEAKMALNDDEFHSELEKYLEKCL